MMKGVTVWNPVAAAVDVAIVALLCNSSFNLVLKLSAGKSRTSPAIPASASNSGSPPPAGDSPASRDSIAPSNRSNSSCSGMAGLHLRAQVLEGAQLKLFHRSFAAPQGVGNLPYALLLHKPHVNHAELRLREPLHQLEQHSAALDFVRRRLLLIRRWRARFPARALEVVRDYPGCN